jgi:uncharacterized integral membrane protein
MRWVRRWIGVALIAAVLVVGWSLKAGNATTVAVDFLFGSVHLELLEALLGAFSMGFAIAGCGWLGLAVRSRMVQRRYRKIVGGLESEIHQLRNLPLDTSAPPPDARGGQGGARAARWGG